MRWLRITINILVVIMALVPFYTYIETESEAAVGIPMGYNPSLLLTNSVPKPALDRITQLNQLVITPYLIGPSDDIWSICQRFKLKNFAFTIRSSNDLDENPSAGTVIKIPNRVGTLFHMDTPQSLHAITTGFEVGRKGGADYERQVLELNGYPVPDLTGSEHSLKTGTTLFLPDAFLPTGLPVPFHDMHYRVTSGFTSHRRHPVLGITRAHHGMDLARPYGDPVYVSRAGVVTFAGWMGGYGNMIEIRHVLRKGHIRFTRYGHLSAILVHEGQRVSLGKMIGRVGSTGISTGPHLHYEVRDENGTARNPARSL